MLDSWLGGMNHRLAGSRLNAMLVGVLSPVWRQRDSYQFEEDPTAWDTRITEYERDSGKMEDHNR